MNSIDQVLSKIDELKQLVESRLTNLRVVGRQVAVNALSDISKHLGLIRNGEIRFGNIAEPGRGFTGLRIGYPFFTYDGIEFNFATVIDDTLVMGIDASSGTMYLGGVTNGISISRSGILLLNGTATTWQDVDFPIIVRTTGVGIPTLTALNGNITLPLWKVNDVNVCESQEFVHQWKENSPVYWHLHLTTGALDATDRYVRFTVEFGYVTPNGVWVFPAVMNSGDLLISANTPAKTMLIKSIGSFTPTSDIGGHCVAVLKRVAATGAAPVSDPWIPMLQLHLECNSLGSNTITDK